MKKTRTKIGPCKKLLHITGQTALVRIIGNGLVLAQFDNHSHKHAFGWYLYKHKDFQPIKHRR